MTDANPDYLPSYLPDDDDPSLLSHRDLVERVEEAICVCRQHNNAASNIGAHALAGKILKILEGGK